MPPKRAAAASSSKDEDDEPSTPPPEDDAGQSVPIVPQSDKKSEAAFLDVFRKLDKAPSETVRFFDRRDYYSVHGDDALFVAEQLFKTMSVLKYWDPGNIPCVYVSKASFESFARQLLLDRRYKIEIWGNENRQWVLTKRASPGNLDSFEDILFRGTNEMNDSAIVVAVTLTNVDTQWYAGVAYVDTTAMKLGVCEFADNEQLTNLESALVRLGAKECLISSESSSAQAKKLREVLDRCDVAITERKKSEFGTTNIETDVARLVAGDEQHLTQLGMKNAMAALACAVGYVGLLSDHANHHRYTLHTIDLERYIKIDGAATKALNLFPAPGDTNKNMSLFGLLNKCKTAIGSRMLAQWIKQPLLDLNEINKRHDIVQVFVEDGFLRQSLMETHLRHVPDLGRLCRKFLRKNGATLQDAFRLYKFVGQLPSLAAALNAAQAQSQQIAETFVQPLEGLINDFEQFINLIENTIDMDAVDRHEFLISPKFDNELQRLSNRKENVYNHMIKESSSIAHDLGLTEEKVKLEFNSVHGYYCRIGRKDEKSIRSKKKYTVLDTRKDGVRFTSPDLRAKSNEYKEISDAYNVQQQSLIDGALEVIVSYCPAMEELSELIAALDVYVALSHVSANAPEPYVRPKMTAIGEGSIILKRCRHPCLEAMDDITFIPNDVEMIRGKSFFQIITGPNMGGKSTYIRQVGVNILMAQMGCFVPCEEAEICVTSAIFARIGASDNQLKGVSTFMAEMLETATILRAADERSFIIVDELGRGTSTYDGFGLAWAISEFIVNNIKAPTLFASHFHELTELEYAVAGVKNLHVQAHVDHGKLTMLYTVKDGPCDQSFGIHVAELAQFPRHVVEMAKRKAEELENFESSSSSSNNNNGADPMEVDKDDAMITDQTEDEARKKRRMEDKQGRLAVLQFLKEFAKLPMDSVTPKEACERVQKLKESFGIADNPFVQRLLAQQQ